MSINNKFIFYIAFILLSGFLISSSLSYYFAKRTLTDKTINEVLPLINDSIYAEIQNKIMIPIHTTSLMAQDDFVISWVEEGELNSAEMQNYLTRIKDKYSYSSTFFVSRSTLNYYRHDGILKKISNDDHYDNWYYNFINLNRSYALQVDTDEDSNGAITLFINHRLENKSGELLGAVGAGLLLKDLNSEFHQYQDKFNRLIYMVDSSGLIQVHPDDSFIKQLNIKNLEGLSTIAEEVLNKKEHTQSYIYQNGKNTTMMSVHYFANLDWFLIVEEDENSALGSIENALWTNIITGILITTFIIFIVGILTKKYQRKILQLSSIDDLTGLYNRRQFTRSFNHLHSFSKKHKLAQSLMMIDIDHFKEVNDLYGHLAGDMVLKNISSTIYSCLREEDLIARWGGEEFVVSLSPTNEKTTLKTANRILEKVENIEHIIEGKKVSCTISIGLVVNLTSDLNLNAMLSIADKALYQAKDSGRNMLIQAK